MGYRSIGVLEYWVLNASLHYSNTPLFQPLLRWSESGKRNEADGPFSADLSHEPELDPYPGRQTEQPQES